MRYDQACAALAEAPPSMKLKHSRRCRGDARLCAAGQESQRRGRCYRHQDAGDAAPFRADRRAKANSWARRWREHGGRVRIDGLRANPSIVRPTLAMQGIDKNLAHQARVLGQLSDAEFEGVIADAASQGQSRRAQYSPRDRDRDRAANPIVLAPSKAAPSPILKRSPRAAIAPASSTLIRRCRLRRGARRAARAAR